MSIDYRTTARWAGLASLPVVAWLITLAVTPARSHAVPPPPSAAAASLTELSTAFSDIAEGVRPSVVYITTKRNGEAEMTSFEVPPEFRQFFGLPDGSGRRHPTVMTASGSGFVVSQDGYILTNAHVVEGAQDVRVRLLDRREFPAKVVGSDPTTDIAVVKIKATGLQAATLGSSAATRVGEWVLAVGNPFGENLSFTVTQGIVSARGGPSICPTGRAGASRTSSRPTPPSTRGTRVARWSIPTARSSASTAPSRARTAPIRATASPCRSTWRARSWTS
ncbi:MAG: trypsin-like peptidase domain-containing protein [Gemmatimonadales bacterium]